MVEGKPGPFKVPDGPTRLAALGPLPGAPWRVRKSLEAILGYFSPIQKPGPEDWLANYDEEGQTFEVFISQKKHAPDQTRNTIYIQPLEDTIDDDFLKQLQQFCEAFFLGMKIAIKKRVDVAKAGITSRINEGTGKRQYHAGEILSYLQSKIPADGFCLIACLMTDIYPRESWNFVFGLASSAKRTGVFSFARYDEAFFEEEKVAKADRNTIIYRSCRVMGHEIGHMFGLKHCIFHDCLMNGSNHLEESSRKISELCPICLRKLQHSIKFDILERYKMLQQFYAGFGSAFAKDLAWINGPVGAIEEALKTAPPPAPAPVGHFISVAKPAPPGGKDLGRKHTKK
jgi:archaemetzincin